MLALQSAASGAEAAAPVAKLNQFAKSEPELTGDLAALASALYRRVDVEGRRNRD